jgi:very-short-patch-repair endonuclease
MKDAQLRSIARGQRGLVARWQLIAAGWSDRRVEARAARHGWHPVFDGVYLLGEAEPDREQRWLAACLTAPGTLLAGPSAIACFGLGRDPAVVFVVRPGSGGPRQFGAVRVSRSRLLGEDVAWHDGIPILSPERAIIDMAPHVPLREVRKMIREGIRLGRTSAGDLLDAAARHRGRRGVVAAREQATICADLPLRRAKSDAESFALERLVRAGLPIPALNENVGGVEADLVDHDRRRIIEIDGPQFHLFADEDEADEAAWAAAGYTVERLPSDAIFR